MEELEIYKAMCEWLADQLPKQWVAEGHPRKVYCKFGKDEWLEAARKAVMKGADNDS